MKKTALCFVILFLHPYAARCNVKYDSLPVVEIINSDLNLLIDSFLDYEVNHNCYHKDYFYVLSISEWNPNTPVYFVIEGLGPFVLNLLVTDKYFFKRKGNTFLIRGNPPKSWYRQTGKIEKVDLHQIQENVYVVTYDLSRWACWYRDGMFFIQEKYECGYKPTIKNFR